MFQENYRVELLENYSRDNSIRINSEPDQRLKLNTPWRIDQNNSWECLSSKFAKSLHDLIEGEKNFLSNIILMCVVIANAGIFLVNFANKDLNKKYEYEIGLAMLTLTIAGNFLTRLNAINATSSKIRKALADLIFKIDEPEKQIKLIEYLLDHHQDGSNAIKDFKGFYQTIKKDQDFATRDIEMFLLASGLYEITNLHEFKTQDLICLLEAALNLDHLIEPIKNKDIYDLENQLEEKKIANQKIFNELLETHVSVDQMIRKNDSQKLKVLFKRLYYKYLSCSLLKESVNNSCMLLSGACKKTKNIFCCTIRDNKLKQPSNRFIDVTQEQT